MEDYVFFYLLFIRPLLLLELARRQNRRSIWSRQLFLDRNKGAGSSLLPALYSNHPDLFFNYTRMSKEKFMHLLKDVTPMLKKKKTRLRTPIPPVIRLAVCLRFLATGSLYPELSYAFRISKSAICQIIKETCRAIVNVLKSKYMSMPSTPSEWEDVEVGFEVKWNFPHCVGAIDGKHIAIQAPPASGSSFINYKGYHSIVLMAACDAQYCFTFVDVGNYGRESDGGVFGATFLARKLQNDPNFLPRDTRLPNSKSVAPYVFVSDNGFPLQTHILNPFPGHFLQREKRIFNYRLSRARRCIENAFGILAARWRILHTTMALSPDNAAWATMACCCLHNFLMKSEMSNATRTYCLLSFADHPAGNGLINDGYVRSQQSLPSLVPLSNEQTPVNIRNIFCDYFNAEGAVSWQEDV